MRLLEQLREPWGVVAAVVSGTLVGIVTTDVSNGLLVGVAVYAAKAGVLSLLPSRVRSAVEGSRPASDTSAGHWLERAEGAVSSLHRLSSSAQGSPAAGAVADVDNDAETTIDDLRRLAAQVVAVEEALGRVDVRRLQADRPRLEQQRDSAPTPELREQVERSLASLDTQLQVSERLHGVRLSLLTRMQSAALGLEGLVARYAEVLALASTAGGVDTVSTQIDQLAGALDGLRTGLAETEALSRRALQAAGPEPTPA